VRPLPAVLAAALLAAALLAAACTDTDPGDPGSETGTDGGGGAPDDPGASAADAAPPAGPLERNGDIDTVVVWSQNIRMRMENWQNIVRCMGDRACNGMDAVPDLVLLQEASCDDTAAIEELMAAPREEGGLGISGWKHFCVENFSDFSGHWMSNGIIWRSDRFAIENEGDAQRIAFYSGDGSQCSLQGKKWPLLKLLDLPRLAAGKLEQRVTVAVRHDDQFGAAGKNTCDADNAPTVFCNWKNSKIIEAAAAALGGGLKIMAGDWNYAASYCTYDGVMSTGFKHDYACTTKGLTPVCDGGATPNLGWRDALLEANPAVYDDWSAIDFIHGKDLGRPAVLSVTARNDRPGVIGAHFYCQGHGPYSGPGEAGDESQRMTDHGGRLARFHY
jgi:hypothetical protein